MADTTYQPKVYRKQGGDELVVASAGILNIETGGILQADGTQASAIPQLTNASTETGNNALIDVASSTSTLLARATHTNANFEDVTAKLNAIFTALSGAGIIATT